METDAISRKLKRKQEKPQIHKKDYEKEHLRMGIKNPVDLIVGDPDAERKYNKKLIQYTQEERETKKDKEVKYLTIEALLMHPYFMNINEADISVVIDEFEKLQ